MGGFLRRLGPLGVLIQAFTDPQLIQAIAEAISGGTRAPSAEEIEQAVDMLKREGYDVHSPGGPTPPPLSAAPPTVRTVPTPDKTKPQAEPARPRGRGEAAVPWPAESVIQTLPTRVRGAFESIPADVQGFSGWVMTPQSSNVHAVAYDYDMGILYVQFRAEGKAVGYKEGVSICSGKAYKIAIRADVPGPTYSYGSAGRPVPVEIFNTLCTARSPGKVVWDKLRVCGSEWQHKFQYTLTDVPSGQNVPRKATRRGYKVRSVPTVGMGRRGSRRSTLPSRMRA